MKISLAWLNTYLDKPVTADEAERLLTAVGFPLDGVEAHGADHVLDVEVTSNRSDCLSHVGVAREIAAASGRQLRYPSTEPLPATGSPIGRVAHVDNQVPSLCPLYTAHGIMGVKVGPSPEWLVQRLEAVGLRPVNNVVDVTNFVLHELGQPLHAFDLAKLDGQRIVVRRAGDGESFAAIDGSKQKLKPDMLVIADASRPQAVAGVMGGSESEVTARTTDILLESARFAPLSIRSTSRALKLASDSSYRFERGVDPHGVVRAAQRAVRLICEIAGGTACQGVLTEGQAGTAALAVELRVARCGALLGYDVAVERMLGHLSALGLNPWQQGEKIVCTIPSYRMDLRREVDLIEEIARLEGYEKIPVEPKMKIEIRPPQPRVLARRELARVLTGHGYFETINFSFMSPKLAQPFLAGCDLLKVDEEKKKNEPALRPSLLPSLLACRKSNQDAGNHGASLFEVGQAFVSQAGAYREARRVAWLADANDATQALRKLRGTLEELLCTIGRQGTYKIVPAAQPPPWADVAAEVVEAQDPSRKLGVYGTASATTLKLFDLQTPVVLAELDYESLISHYPRQPRSDTLARFPAIERDLSLIVDESVRWEALESIVAQMAPRLMERLDFVTTYRGKPVPPGRKSVTLRMTFRDPQRTLLHDEVSRQVDSVVHAMAEKLRAELRL